MACPLEDIFVRRCEIRICSRLILRGYINVRQLLRSKQALIFWVIALLSL